jgi:hypothetical protein
MRDLRLPLGRATRRHPAHRLAFRAGWAAVVISLAPQALPAQGAKLAIGPRFGTSGIGGEVSVGLSRVLSLRGGFSTFSLTLHDKSIENNTYDLSPRLQSVNAFADVHPFAGAFRLTTGVVFSQSRASLVASDLSNGVVLGSGLYTSGEVQGLTGVVRPRKTAPYLGFGFGRARPTRISLSVDMGVVFQGRPRTSLRGETTLTGAERTRFDQDLLAEEAAIQRHIDDAPGVIALYPVLDFGVRVGL